MTANVTHRSTTIRKLLGRTQEVAIWAQANPDRLPSSYIGADDSERVLGYFLARQRVEQAAGRGHPEVFAALDEALPGWSCSRKSPEHWSKRLAETRSTAEGSTREPKTFPDDRAAAGPEVLAASHWARASFHPEVYGWAREPERRERLRTIPHWHDPERAAAPTATKDDVLATLRRVAREIADVAQILGGDPSQTGTTDRERRAGKSLANVRSWARYGLHGWSEEHTAVMDEVYPRWNAPNSRDRLWRKRAAELAAYLAATGTLPAGSAKAGNVGLAATLARWLSKRRYELRAGLPAMTPARVAYLDALVPGWRVA